MIGVSLKRENDNEEILTNSLRVSMTKEELVEKIREPLKTDNDLDFLLRLKKEELERLVACIRDRVGQVGE